MRIALIALIASTAVAACARSGDYAPISPSSAYGTQLGVCDNAVNEIDRQNCRERARDDYETARRMGVPDSSAAPPSDQYIDAIEDARKQEMYLGMMRLGAGLLSPPRYYSAPLARTIYCDPRPLVGGQLECQQ